MADFKCEACNKMLNLEIFLKNFKVCHYCGHHYMLDAKTRVSYLVDEFTFNEIAANIKPIDFLNFVDIKPYKDRIIESQQNTGISEAMITGCARIGGYEVNLGVMDFRFMGGSMGSVAGEKVRQITDLAISNRFPLILVCASGGARMQEGIISLMQMAKTVSAINKVKENKIPYISVITNPTTGGVSASFASIADIIIAEPEALFCFAGPRVVKQTIKKELPLDFGLSERNLKNGQIDMIIARKDLKSIITKLLKLFSDR
ncbi:MAG: acetyl-CoA carboxylase, carboxyltransferase subunit beta [Actinomycetota bacterium]|nr:acetyl-CoA carboxylase, carboxyltransferase subunit beta [Actinomycetota bacterium]